MEKLVIEGGKALKGEVRVSGSKNAALPILAATLLTDGECILKNVPDLRDTRTMMRLLRSLGKKVDFEKGVVTVRANGRLKQLAHYDLVSTMRGSFCVLGPLLAKLKQAIVSLPGGCVIGIRPVDLHLKGIRALGANVDVEGGYVMTKATKLKGNHIYLGGTFGTSVLATANLLMAATLAEGETVIESAACEPEIVELANFLNKMGAKIKGIGSPHLLIKGVKKLNGAEYKVGADRIEAGTFVLMAAAAKGDVVIRDAKYEELLAMMDKLQEVGVKVERERNHVRVKASKNMKPVGASTHPYPGFPTDLQAQYIALMALTPGVSVVTDKVFPDRFMHIAELNRMGAKIQREGCSAIIEGVDELHGAPVMASDLRASAALVIAGLAAQGKTEIHRMYHLERGYEKLDEKLKGLGAKVRREQE